MVVSLADNDLESFKKQVQEYVLIRWRKSLEFKEQQVEQRYKYIELENAFCDYFDVSFHEVLGKNRGVQIARARQFLCFLMWEESYSYPAIGNKVYPDGDHTSALHSVKKVAGLIGRNRSYTTDYTALQEILNKKARLV